jgi:hypothetical protein
MKDNLKFLFRFQLITTWIGVIHNNSIDIASPQLLSPKSGK